MQAPKITASEVPAQEALEELTRRARLWDAWCRWCMDQGGVAVMTMWNGVILTGEPGILTADCACGRPEAEHYVPDPAHLAVIDAEGPMLEALLGDLPVQ